MRGVSFGSGKGNACLALIAFSSASLLYSDAQAGHLFTQNVSNTPTWIKSGQGIKIDQTSMEGGFGSGTISLNFAANASIPSGADTSTDAWWSWSTGDVLKFTVPTSGGASLSTTIAYDASSSCTVDICGGSSGASFFSGTHSPIGSAALALGQSDVSVAAPLVWTLEALAGQFSLAGYRVYFSNGTLNGTGAGPLDQSSVIDSGDLGGTPDMDTTHAAYTLDDVNNGLVNPVFAGGTLVVTDSAEITTSFSVNDTGTGTDGIVFTGAGANVVLTGAVTGAGQLAKAGAGALTLTADNANAGGFSVQDGVLLLANGGTIAGNVLASGSSTFISNGTVSGTTTVTGAGSALRGSGTFGNIVIGGGATHRPGNSPGDVTVNGNYTLAAGGTLEVEVQANGVSDRLFVNGAVDLTGNLVVARFGTGFIAPSYSYTVIANDGADAINGDFATVSDNLAFYTPMYVLNGGDGNDFVLTLNRNANTFQALAATPNQLAAAAALDALAPAAGSQVALEYENLLGLLTAAQVQTALGSFSGEIYASSGALLSDRFTNMLGAHVDNGGVVDSCYQSSTANHRNDEQLVACVLSKSVSIAATGEYRFDRVGDVPATEFLIGGLNGKVLVPIELDAATHANLGAYFTHDKGRVSIAPMASSSGVSSTGVGLVAGWEREGWAVNGSAGYSRGNVDVNRSILNGAGATAASGSFGMDLAGATLGVSYSLDVGEHVVLKPHGSLTHIRSSNSSFNENTTSAFGYSGEAGSYSQTLATLGLGMSTEFVLEDYVVTPRAEISVNHRLGTTGSMVGSVGGSNLFTTMGVDQGDTTARLGLGLTVGTSSGLELNADYGAELYEGGIAHSANFALKLRL